MSFYILSEDTRHEPAIERHIARAADAGFQVSHDLELPLGRLRLFTDQLGHRPAFHAGANGDFATALGTLIFRGVPGETGLAALYDAFELNDFDWSGLLGIHVVLIRKHGVLHVFGDSLGACKVYTGGDGDVWSNSFLALADITSPRHFDIQACYEYVINGSIYGTRTPAREIKALPGQAVLVVDQSVAVVKLADPLSDAPPTAQTSLDEIAQRHVSQLDDVFGPIASVYGNRLRVSFSGGFDSRLMLAMLMRHGAKPTLFVYGHTNDEDVRIARLICAAEGLELENVDKDQAPVDFDALEENLRRDFVAFDGWKLEQTLFDFGVDRHDRLSRHRDGQVPLNGSLGEIYRNFHYMPDRPASTGDVVSTFYSPYDPQAFTARFDEHGYRSRLAKSMREAIGADGDRLARYQIEALYPKFRGRFWTGRDAQINQRFGPMFFPYLETTAIAGTSAAPIAFKDHGILQGRMIELVSERLAAYPSDYGFALSGARPLKYRIKSYLGTHRPPALRALSFRLTHRAPQPRDGALSDAQLGRVLDLQFPLMRTLFDIDKVYSTQQFGRIGSLEYLGQQLGLDVPSGA